MAYGTASVALGSLATAGLPGQVSSGQVALGNNSNAIYANSVALGTGSVTGSAAPTGKGYLTGTAAPLSEVSVGSSTALRRITNVADGSAPQDAATVSQLTAGMTTTTTSIANLSSSIANGTLGLVQQASAAPGNGAITMGSSTGGTSVNFTGTAGARQLNGVAAGTLATDAVNLGQLTSSIGQATALAVNYDAADMGNLTLGGANGTVIHNVAAGTLATDAANVGQVDSAVASEVGQATALAVSYDATDKGNLTLGGANGTVIHNVAAGSAATDAVNMSQLNTLSDLESQDVTAINNLNSQMTTVNNQMTTVNGQITTLTGEMTGAQSDITTLQQTPAGTGTPSTIAVDGSGSATATASGGVAVGSGAKAGGTNGTAIGGNSFAAGPNDTALGGNAQVNADGSTAVGANTTIAAVATNAVAVGESASVTVASGTAIGQGASVTAANAVALGQGSVANVANTVSVGTATNQRQITNVAAGVQATDAANVNQVNAALATAKTYTDTSAQQTLSAANAYTNQAITGANGNLTNFESQVSDQFQTVDKRIEQQGAMSAASTQMAINAAGATGNGRIAAGVGYQASRSAISVGYATSIGSKAHVSFGATASGSQTSVGAGFGLDL
ncbi:hypothetical protein [Rhodanobacter sp. A1T4]|uniref:YadA family autotransporter adhesin n=1 Tax=Rhodanobacter sp. A1T4 TaxID=2723087 RepID=UPI0017BFCD88|nr:autotransporter adhesin [Rhodanobacter sp. A1T4]